MTQQTLAELSRLSISLIVQLEAGRRADPKVSTVRALARALDVSIADLLEGLDEPPPPPKQRGKKQ
jgi:transcriptional regulator with XRE-family HTH domain